MDIDSLLASIPTPSAEYMATRGPLARRYTLVFLRSGPVPSGDDARQEQLQLEHLQHLTKLQILEKLIFNGPTLIEHDIRGVSIYDADVDEARALAEADPRVRAGQLSVEAIPWIAVPSDSQRR